MVGRYHQGGVKKLEVFEELRWSEVRNSLIAADQWQLVTGGGLGELLKLGEEGERGVIDTDQKAFDIKYL